RIWKRNRHADRHRGLTMGKYPILKPREVASVLETLGFVEVRQRGFTSSTGIQMVDSQLFRSIRAATFPDSLTANRQRYWSHSRRIPETPVGRLNSAVQRTFGHAWWREHVTPRSAKSADLDGVRPSEPNE